MELGIKDGVTLAIALFAAVLSLLNTWHDFNRDKVRLRVRFELFVAANIESVRKGISFTVTNLGGMPVTLSRIGISLPGKQQLTFLLDEIGTTLPHRMDPRTSVTLVMHPRAENHPQLRTGTNIFVETGCGLTFRGSNRREFRRHVKKIGAAS